MRVSERDSNRCSLTVIIKLAAIMLWWIKQGLQAFHVRLQLRQEKQADGVVT